MEELGPGQVPTLGQRLKKAWLPIAAVLVVGLKLAAKLKLLVLPLVKLLPVLLKTGGTMILSVGVYAMAWGFWFALGFVLLLLVHECGHLVAAKRLGLDVGAPVFIPFMGAFIALRDAPRNAWVEAQVGMGGPLLGSVGALACFGLGAVTGQPLFSALAYTGFLLNLFNLAPLGFLDGGRIVTALSPWLWLVGLAVIAVLTVTSFNFLLLLILLFSLPRVFFLFRKKTEEEKRYFEVTPGQRLATAVAYFGLLGLLVFGMKLSHVPMG